eukprot:Gb_34388 [translate_table: standard]
MRRSRVSSCSSTKSSDGQLKRGPWTPEEDMVLIKYIEANGVGSWSTLSKEAGLMRSRKSCRLRWMNYLRPEIKRGHISQDEEELIIRLHNLLGNRWSLIAGRVPGRTDNDVKNYWNIHLSKKLVHKDTEFRTRKSVPNESIKGKSISQYRHEYKSERKGKFHNDTEDVLTKDTINKISTLSNSTLGKNVVSAYLNKSQSNSPKDPTVMSVEFKHHYLQKCESAMNMPNFISNSNITCNPSLECSMTNNSTMNYNSNYSDKEIYKSRDENVAGFQYCSTGGIDKAPSTTGPTTSDRLKEIAESVQTDYGSELQQNPCNFCRNTEDGRSDSFLLPNTWFDSLPWPDSSEMDLLFFERDIEGTSSDSHDFGLMEDMC